MRPGEKKIAADCGFAALFLRWDMARVCVFVDGENFRHSIVQLFKPEFNEAEYLPRHANWSSLFDLIVGLSADDPFRVRTYWYVVERLDFAPYRVEGLRNDPVKAQSVLRQHGPYDAELNALSDAHARDARVGALLGDLLRRKTSMQRRFDGWRVIQESIAERHFAVEFRRAGGIRYSLFDSSLGSEKAVDVKLACDMVVLKDIYDVAVIVSGDQDYVPAVGIVKDAGKRVVNVSFQARNGNLLPGGARRLNEAADTAVFIKHGDLAQHLGITVSRTV